LRTFQAQILNQNLKNAILKLKVLERKIVAKEGRAPNVMNENGS